MIINDLNDLKNKDHFAIIIGSGPAGITTALELESKKIKSIILEAGNISQDENSTKFLEARVSGDTYSDLSNSRLRQFGGASGHWGGNCNPLSKENFKDWPINNSDLDDYNFKARKILNLDNKKKFYLEKFSDNLNLYNLMWSNVRFGEKYLNHIKKSKNIFLSLNTNFLNFVGNNKKVKYLICSKNNITYKLKSKFYILSCGGIENSRLLLLSKSKNKNLFDSRLPIGNYYMDHPYHNVGSGLLIYEKFIEYFNKKNIINVPLLTCQNDINISANNNFLLKNNIPNGGLYVSFKNINESNDLFKQVRCVAPKFIKNVYEKLKVKKTYKINLGILQEQVPKFDNKISLDYKKDPLNIPLPVIYWKKSTSERNSAKLISEELSKIFIDNDIGRISLNEHLYDNSDYDVIAGNHQLGGTRIGLDVNDSVVDKNLKVHNIKNLFINGSSIFRTSGHTHPTYTIVKFALRLANYLSKSSV
jgi:hypothetical protein